MNLVTYMLTSKFSILLKEFYIVRDAFDYGSVSGLSHEVLHEWDSTRLRDVSGVYPSSFACLRHVQRHAVLGGSLTYLKC